MGEATIIINAAVAKQVRATAGADSPERYIN